jgi:hypothetical protein
MTVSSAMIGCGKFHHHSIPHGIVDFTGTHQTEVDGICLYLTDLLTVKKPRSMDVVID